jgi:hypothetical protein
LNIKLPSALSLLPSGTFLGRVSLCLINQPSWRLEAVLRKSTLNYLFYLSSGFEDDDDANGQSPEVQPWKKSRLALNTKKGGFFEPHA